MRYSKCKEIDAAVKNRIRQGWTFAWGEKHGCLRPPEGGARITVPKSPSDWRANLNFQRDLRHLANRMGKQ